MTAEESVKALGIELHTASEDVTEAPAEGNSPFGDGSENSSSDDDLEEEKPKKEKNRRPVENPFTQQRLEAVNPVLTAKTVIPLLLALAVFLLPLGGAMWIALHRVEDVLIDYSQCENLASTDHWSPIPDNFTRYRYKGSPEVATAQWKLDTDESQRFEDERKVCRIQFSVPHKLKLPLYFFYRLEKFSQNHRRYVKSFSEDQIEGKAALVSLIKDTVGLNCEPLSINSEGKRIYPCGLIANSMFNDTFDETLYARNGTSDDYKMTSKGIAWKLNPNRYKKTKYDYRDIVPPPNWYKWFPDGYNSTNVPDILTWEQFQNWMFTLALQDFNKLALRNDHDAMDQGVYEIVIGLHFPVLPYKGKKMIFISQRSALGGKNFFLGYAWMATGGVCLFLALALLAVNLVKPRKLGDKSLLSWNQEEIKKDES